MHLIAHRGLTNNNICENTLKAFKNALNNNYDSIELDLRKTKDNIIVVLHDKYINRTSNGSGNINKLLLADLKDLGLIEIGTLKYMFVKPLYINEESNKYINIDNFDKVVTYYDEYKNGVKYKTCKECGKRFKRRSNNDKYCQKCAKIIKQLQTNEFLKKDKKHK